MADPTYADVAAGRAQTAPLLHRAATTITAPSPAGSTVSGSVSDVSGTVLTTTVAVAAAPVSFSTSVPSSLVLQTYSTVHEARDALQEWAGGEGFAVAIQTTKYDRGTASIACRLHSSPRTSHSLTHAPETRLRPQQSMKSGCRFRVDLAKEGDSWTMWTAHTAHNHPRFPYGTFIEQRRLKGAARERLRSLADESTQPLHIHTILQREFPSIRSWLTRRRVADLVGEHRSRRGCYNDVEDILAKLREPSAHRQDDLIRVLVDTHGRACGLFFSTRDARALTRRYLSTFALDCTYKTNLYKLPLLEIVGVSGTGRSFTSAVILMVSESTQWYTLALKVWRDFMGLDGSAEPRTFITDRDTALRNALDDVFPDAAKILCLWHIMRNILAGKGGLSLGETREFIADWTKVVLEWTEDKFLAALARLRERYRDGRFSGVRAVAERAVKLDGRSFVACYTKQYRTLGIRASSRAESKHAALKRRLGTSKGDLVSLTNAVRDVMMAEWTEITAALAKDMLNNCERYSVMFEGLARNISIAAMKRLQEQHRLLQSLQNEAEAVENCSGGYRATQGLPCWHELRLALEHDIPLSIAHIDTHWHLDTAENIRAGYSIAEYTPLGVIVAGEPETVATAPTEREVVVNGASVILEDGGQAIHLNNVYRPSRRVISRGVIYSSNEVQVVTTQVDGLPARGAGPRPRTGRGSRGGNGSTQRDATQAEIVEAEAEAEEAAATAQPSRARWCSICNKNIRHRGICPRARRRTRPRRPAVSTAPETAAETIPETQDVSETATGSQAESTQERSFMASLLASISF